MPELYLTPTALLYGPAGAVMLYLAFHLLIGRDASRSTRLLGVVVLLAGVNNLANALWTLAFGWSPAATLSLLAVAGLAYFLVLFAYSLGGVPRPRELRIATVLFGLNAAALAAHAIGALSFEMTIYSPVALRCFGFEAEPAAAQSAWWTAWMDTWSSLVPYAWTLVVLMRNCVYIEARADVGRWRALLRPVTDAGRAVRNFALLALGVTLIPTLHLVGLSWSTPIVMLFVTSATVWVHINHATEPISLRFKLVAIPLAGVVGILGLVLSRTATADHAQQITAHATEAHRVLARLEAAQPAEAQVGGTRGAGSPQVRLDPTEVSEHVTFVVSRPAVRKQFPQHYDLHFGREGFHPSLLVASNRTDAAWRAGQALHGLLLRDPTLDREQAQATIERQLEDGTLTALYSQVSGQSFFGALQGPDARWRAWRFESDDRVIEVGYTERGLRRALHERLLPYAVVMLVAGAFIVLGFPLLFRTSVLGPIEKLLEGVRRVEAGDLSAQVPVRSSDEFGVLARAFEAMVASVRQARSILERTNRAAFRFVPQSFLRQLGNESILEARLGQQQRLRMTVLFADIREFTSLAESMTPEETFAFVNEFLAEVGPTVRGHGGFIDKYLGDAIMALFPGPAVGAVAAAVELRADLARFNERRLTRGLPAIRIGVGLHTGDLILGIIGDDERMDGTVIADVVNTASRLEGLTKRYQAVILMSEATRAELDDRERWAHRFVERVQVKGRAGVLAVYEVFEGAPATETALLRATAAELLRGWDAWAAGRFDEAAAAFEAVLAHDPEDRVARLHLDRAREWLGRSAPPGWDGVQRMDRK